MFGVSADRSYPSQLNPLQKGLQGRAGWGPRRTDLGAGAPAWASGARAPAEPACLAPRKQPVLSCAMAFVPEWEGCALSGPLAVEALAFTRRKEAEGLWTLLTPRGGGLPQPEASLPGLARHARPPRAPALNLYPPGGWASLTQPAPRGPQAPTSPTQGSPLPPARKWPWHLSLGPRMYVSLHGFVFMSVPAHPRPRR